MTTPPPLLASLEERLKAPAYWKSSDGYSEAFDNAPEQAATALEALAAERDALREALAETAETAREVFEWHCERGGETDDPLPADQQPSEALADLMRALERARATLNGAPQP